MIPPFPLIGLGTPSEGIAGIGTTGQTTMPSGVTGAVGTAAKETFKSMFGGSFLGALFGGVGATQYLTGIVGLILIVAGIFLFRPVRETVVSAGKAAAKGAMVA